MTGPLGDGWRQVPLDEYRPYSRQLRAVVYQDGAPKYWLPVPPPVVLPTDPYTVIRVHGRPQEDSSLFVLTADDEWSNAVDAMFLTSADLAECITGFEVLASPHDEIRKEHIDAIRADERRETAKAVLDPLFDALEGDGKLPGRVLAEVAREFGVGP